MDVKSNEKKLEKNIKRNDRGNIVKQIVHKLVFILVFLAMEALLIHWNTNTYLMRKDKTVEITQMSVFYEGRRAEVDIDTVDTLEKLIEKEDIEGYYIQVESMEATGYYKLLSPEYEGVVRKGKTFNIFPRKMFTSNTFLPTVYRGMYGQFYKATLLDGNRVLLLVGCNDMDAVEAGNYTNMVARYHTQVVEGLESSYKNETSERIQQLEASMNVAGYINIADISWAKRHDFGLFMMNIIKAVIATVVAGVAAYVMKNISSAHESLLKLLK